MEIGVRTCSYKVQCNYCDIKHSKYISSYLSLVCLHSLDTLKLLPGHTTAMPPEVTNATPTDKSSPAAVTSSDMSISLIVLLDNKYLGD